MKKDVKTLVKELKAQVKELHKLNETIKRSLSKV